VPRLTSLASRRLIAPRLIALSLAVAPIVADAQQAAVGRGLANALTGGTFDLSLAYRFEFIDQGEFSSHANASLLRTRLTYETAELRGLSLLLEVDDLRDIGADSFNSTRNGKVTLPVVADPQGTAINRLQLRYRAEAGTEVALGRQRLTASRRRFIASLNWRLNEQTFDGLTIKRAADNGIEAAYAYVTNVSRLFGPDDGVPPANLRGELHLFDGTLPLGGDGLLQGYAYLLDFNAAPELSSATFGGRFAHRYAINERLSLPYSVEVARQSDYANNPVGYHAGYLLLEAGLSADRASVTFGYEILEGDGTPGHVITTPLAGLNGLNGWADQFLAIPDDGLEDASLRFTAPIAGLELSVVAHRFAANHGGSHYGDELDVALNWPLSERYALLVRVADYEADSYGADTLKAWLMVTASF